MDWCTIESDPAVFTELIENIGVKGISVEEVYSLDDEASISNLGHIYGFIFLFRYTKNLEEPTCLVDFDPELFFAHQVVNNACGTQAILSVLLNIPDLELAGELQTFKEFAINLDPNSRGYAIGESELLRSHHNAFAKPEPFIFDMKKKAKDGDDVFHFISYLPFKKNVYELDGMQQGPILLGEVQENASWINIAKNEINKRIERYSNNEIRFTLLAITKSKKIESQHKIDEIRARKGHYLRVLSEKLGGDFVDSEYPDYAE